MLAADTMEALGIPRGQYVVKVNNRKVLDGVMECGQLISAEKSASPSCARSTSSIGSALKACAMLLGKGRKDESGDFTKGAELNDRSN